DRNAEAGEVEKQQHRSHVAEEHDVQRQEPPPPPPRQIDAHETERRDRAEGREEMDAHRRPGWTRWDVKRGPVLRREGLVEGREECREALQDVVVKVVRQLEEVPEMDELPPDESEPGQRLLLDELQPLAEPEPGRLHRRQLPSADLRGAI